MSDIFLIHWNEAEAQEHAGRIRAWGHRVCCETEDGARGGKAILARPPAAVVVDLSRLPSHGRETAGAVRAYKAGRAIPIVFLPGDPAKMDKVRLAVPDGIWTTWERLRETLDRIVPAIQAGAPSQITKAAPASLRPPARSTTAVTTRPVRRARSGPAGGQVASRSSRKRAAG